MNPRAPELFPFGKMANANPRGHFKISIATTSGHFATRNAAGIEQVHKANPQVTQTIAAYGSLTFWSCRGPRDAKPAGDVTALICVDNSLTSLEIATLSKLQYLDCSYNQLETLDIAGAQELKTLLALENRLFSLPLSGLPNLQSLDCYGNQLLSLDLTGLARLEVVDCSANRLLTLKLTGCRSLHTLYAYCNQIAHLDLSGLSSLQSCDVDHTRPYRLQPGSNLSCNEGPSFTDQLSAELAQTVADTRSVVKYISPRLRSLTPEESKARATTYALKAASAEAVEAAAPAMAALIDGNCWLVPVPASNGNLNANLTLCRAIAQLVPGARVKCAVGRARPVESSSKRRLSGHLGLLPADHQIIRVAWPLEPLPVYFVDNVITSGATIAACRRALGWGTGLTYADASSRKNTLPLFRFPHHYTQHEATTQNHTGQ
jgi:hypothetical protein